ncbi:MAG: ABC transporter substrate-binding protein [Clostridia bacterium]|nr:ABC transporter substrate-binding protein [Clostridia bacterium]
MKKLLSLSLAFIACLSTIALVGCSGDGKTKIRLCEVTHSVFYAPVYVAINNGYFDEYDMKIELSNGGGADKVMTAIASKSADIGLMGPEATIYCQAQGQRDYPIIFGQLTQKDGSFLVAKTDQPNFEWTDLAGKHILAGRLGGVPAMTMQYIVNNAGLNHETDLNFNTTVAFNMMAPVFESDDTVDYTTLFEPTASEMVSAGKGYIVASVGQSSGEIPYTSFSASKSFIDGNPTLIENFLRAILKAMDFIKNNTADTVAQSLAPSFAGTSLSSLATAVTSYRNIDAWKEDLIFTEAGYSKLQDVMQNAGFLESRVTFADAVDNTYATRANGEK